MGVEVGGGGYGPPGPPPVTTLLRVLENTIFWKLMGIRYFSEKSVMKRKQLIIRIKVTGAPKFDKIWAFRLCISRRGNGGGGENSKEQEVQIPLPPEHETHTVI